MKVYKFGIADHGTTKINLPITAYPIRVAWQEAGTYIWFHGEFNHPSDVVRTFHSVFTGEDVPDAVIHVGSVEHNGIVIHVFEQL